MLVIRMCTEVFFPLLCCSYIHSSSPIWNMVGSESTNACSENWRCLLLLPSAKALLQCKIALVDIKLASACSNIAAFYRSSIGSFFLLWRVAINPCTEYISQGKKYFFWPLYNSIIMVHSMVVFCSFIVLHYLHVEIAPPNVFLNCSTQRVQWLFVCNFHYE